MIASTLEDRTIASLACAGDLVPPQAGYCFTGDFVPAIKFLIVEKCYPSGYDITGDLIPGVIRSRGVPNSRDTGLPLSTLVTLL